MSKLFPLLVGLMLFIMAGNGVARAAEAVRCPESDQTAAVMSCEDAGVASPDDEKAAHQHAPCHGQHVAMPAQQAAAVSCSSSASLHGSARIALLSPHDSGTVLRPPQA